MTQTPLLLGQVLKPMVNSQRLLIVDENGKELYRGFVANLVHSSVNRYLQVKEINLLADVFTKAKRTERLPATEKLLIPREKLLEFRFADLDCVVYQKIVVTNEMEKLN